MTLSAYSRYMKYATFGLETAFFEQGYAAVAGIDEAGRGCWAGPVVAAVVVVSSADQFVVGVRDSKQMSKSARERAFNEIVDRVESYGIGQAEASEIDEIGINEAGSLAMQRAYAALSSRPEIVLVDGSKITSPNLPGKKIDQGDSKHFVIAAASVLAKVFRDRLMRELAALEEYAGYGFDRHVGYGTAFHRDALRKRGVSDIHRKSFAPVRKMLKQTRT